MFHNPITRTLPGAVAEAFPTVTPVHLRRLGLAHVLCLALAFLDDRLNDDDVAFSRDLNLLKRSMEAEMQARLSEVVGTHAGYWRAARQALRDYAVAHVREAADWRGGRAEDDSHARYARAAAGKLAPARLSALAVAILGGASTSVQTRITRAVDECVIGLQYVDDVDDWEEDYRRGRPTYFVRRHLTAHEWRRRERVPVAELRSRVHLSDTGVEFLQRASHHFGRCATLLDGLPMPTLRTWAARQRDEWARRALVIHRDHQRFHQTLLATWQRRWTL